MEKVDPYIFPIVSSRQFTRIISDTIAFVEVYCRVRLNRLRKKGKTLIPRNEIGSSRRQRNQSPDNRHSVVFNLVSIVDVFKFVFGGNGSSAGNERLMADQREVLGPRTIHNVGLIFSISIALRRYCGNSGEI